MKHLIIVAMLGLAACATPQQASSGFTVKADVDSDIFVPDEIYGVRHGPSGAVCPGAINGAPLVRGVRGQNRGLNYDWCEYSDKLQTYKVRMDRRPGETAPAGLLALKASDLKDPASWTEAAADIPDRQAVGFTEAKADASRGLWVTRAGDWRISVIADYPEAKRADVLSAVSEYFRKLRSR